MANSRHLSKSRYIAGLQCLRLLWIEVNQPERIPAPDAVTQHTFDQGHEVGSLAQSLFPGGTCLPEDLGENIKQTQASLGLRRPLFEAGFSSWPLYCRVDILNPVGEDAWDIIEVKSSTEVKDEHLYDVAFQRFCLERAGLNTRRCYIMRINRDYIKQGEVDPHGLFITEDVTDRLEAFSCGLAERIDDMLELILLPACPDGVIGRRCDDPFPCPLAGECWRHLPQHHVMTLTYGKKLGEELLGRGILAIADIPPDVRLSEKQCIQRDCVLNSAPHINHPEIRGFLKTLKHPLHFMDFETFATAIPLYDGTHPYQNIPFQFSLHALVAPGAMPLRYSFLAEGREDPRSKFLAALREAIGDKGSIIVYNQTFEKTILKESAEAFPEHRGWIDAAIARIVDLMAPFKGFLYYHPDQCGSASLKCVLPSLTGLSYDGLDIADGQMASLEYMRATFGGVDEAERRRIRAALETYCGQDTSGMLALVDRLRELAP